MTLNKSDHGDVGIPGNEELPERLSADLASRMLGGERIIWIGKPARLDSTGFFLVFLGFTILLAGWTLAFAAIVFNAQIDRTIGLRDGLLTMAIAIPLLGPLRARRTARYVLTNRRVFIWAGTLFTAGNMEIIYPREFTGMYVVRERKDRGDLVFVRETVQTGEGAEIVERGFLGISEVRTVEALVRATLSVPTEPARA